MLGNGEGRHSSVMTVRLSSKILSCLLLGHRLHALAGQHTLLVACWPFVVSELISKLTMPDKKNGNNVWSKAVVAQLHV